MAGDDAVEPGTDPAADESGGAHAVLFFVALLAFLGSILAYGYVLVTGGDVLLPLAVNVAGALAIVGLTAADTYGDPNSGVTSVPGALGTALLMLAAYALVASVAVAATSPLHDRFDLAIWLGAAAALAGVFGFFTFPAEVFGGDGDGGASDAASEPPDGE